ncbi:MAG: hypothetical protein ACI8XB_001673 [Patiriisocius sp.]|jgi:hypothetical protein
MMKVYLSFYFAIVILLLTVPSSVTAQSYGTSLGLRMSNDKNTRLIGLTMQHRILKKVTLEGILQSDFNNNTTFNGLIERHHAFLTKRFNLYAGAGFSIGNEQSEFNNPMTNEVVTTFGNATFGTDFIFGIEATLLSYNFSLDYKPNFNLTGREPWYLGQVGVSVRSVIVKGSKQNKKRRQRSRAKKKREREKEREEDPWLKGAYEKIFKK